MFIALLITAASAYAAFAIPALYLLVYDVPFVLYGVIIAELVLVIVVAACINKLSPTVANILFFTYAAINGLTLSFVFYTFNIGIVFHAFAITALMFAGMALYGAITRRSLASIGSICLMGLFGIIIASAVNFFFRSELVEAIVSYVGVLIFVGLTAYDTQRIKVMLSNACAADHTEAIKKISIVGALSLYLDFINLFLKILRIVGRRR